jgi:hypothetical protein
MIKIAKHKKHDIKEAAKHREKLMSQIKSKPKIKRYSLSVFYHIVHSFNTQNILV